MLAFGMWGGDINSLAVIEGTVEAIYRELLIKIQSVAKCTIHTLMYADEVVNLPIEMLKFL
jgi:hypothetical protein